MYEVSRVLGANPRTHPAHTTTSTHYCRGLCNTTMVLRSNELQAPATTSVALRIQSEEGILSDCYAPCYYSGVFRYSLVAAYGLAQISTGVFRYEVF